MREILFETGKALQQFHDWEREDQKMFNKLVSLLDERPPESLYRPGKTRTFKTPVQRLLEQAD